MAKTRVAILFGGRSAEHTVSLRSAKNVIRSIDKNKYDLVFIGIDMQGNWFHYETQTKLDEIENTGSLTLDNPVGKLSLALEEKGRFVNSIGQEIIVDVAFPVLHGPFGEDGSVQGMFKLASIPFVGPSLLGSAVGMDKDIMKRLLRDAGLPIGKYICLRKSQPFPSFEEIEKAVGMPCFVKPANLGSSVGISKARNEEELGKAISMAFQFDKKIVIEEYIPGREIECAVLGNEDPKASVTGEVVVMHHDFYSFDSKYIDDQGSETQVPADIPKEVQEKIREYAVKTFTTLECEGLSRVDVFYQENGNMVVNEINTIPGFTSISMYPMLWKASGIEYGPLIDKLIQLAFDRYEVEQQYKVEV